MFIIENNAAVLHVTLPNYAVIQQTKRLILRAYSQNFPFKKNYKGSHKRYLLREKFQLPRLCRCIEISLNLQSRTQKLNWNLSRIIVTHRHISFRRC